MQVDSLEVQLANHAVKREEIDNYKENMAEMLQTCENELDIKRQRCAELEA